MSIEMYTPQEKASEIQARIAQLSEMSDADLKTEMQSLKAAIMQNPAACALLLPKDVGAMVAALRRITGFAIQQATTSKAKKEKKPKATPLSAEQLAAALDDEDF